MSLPFTADEFLEVFRMYNLSVWPSQIAFYLLALVAILLLLTPFRYAGRLNFFALSFFWIWMGAVYHLGFFRQINPAAFMFGVFFIIQGLLFLYFGLNQKLRVELKRNVYGMTAIILFIYALIIYPVLSYSFGHIYPYSPTFGLPCPTTIFTLGILLTTKKSVPLILIIIPMLWSILGFSAALSLDIFEDTGLIISGVVFLILYFLKKRQNRRSIHFHFSE